ncbi:hypothetical protein [Streptomyces sp. NPDC091268]|uniref:hypothetical protein n=1 Tax=Streptomyces sp. NPDC091268 TaxID=3365979 RepID=UPI0037F7EEED
MEKDGEEVHSSVFTLDVGTEQAMGVLRGAPVTVHPGKDGTFESTFTPCGVTTHGSTETDHVCRQKDVDASTCPTHSVGDVEQRGRRWVSSKVRVVAHDEPCMRGTSADRGQCEERKVGGEFDLYPQALAEVSWPLKVTGRK